MADKEQSPSPSSYLETPDQRPETIGISPETTRILEFAYSDFNDKQHVKEPDHNNDGIKDIADDTNSEDIIASSASLKRLVVGLKRYDEVEGNDDAMTEFVDSQNRKQLIDDVHNFLAEHQNNIAEIQKELLTKYGFTSCNIWNCAKYRRHYGRKNDAEHSTPNKEDGLSIFFAAKYDAMHVALFHLFETRYRSYTRLPELDNNVDTNFAEALSLEKSLTGAVDFGTLKSQSTKFNLNLFTETAGDLQDVSYSSVHTTTDSIMKYAASNDVARDILRQIDAFLEKAGIDTDAIQEDVSESKDHSNIYVEIKSTVAFQAINRYFRGTIRGDPN